VTGGKVLENDIPVLIVTCTTQEVLLFRDPKTGEIVVGQEDRVEQCTYGAVITRIPEEMDNELTGGWKVVEVCIVQFIASRLILTLCSSFLVCRWLGEPRGLTYRCVSNAWFMFPLSCLCSIHSFGISVVAIPPHSPIHFFYDPKAPKKHWRKILR
jgi:hypothetical protein